MNPGQVSVLIVGTVVSTLNDIISDAQKEAGDWQNKVRMVMATLKRGHVDTGLQRRVLSYLSVTAVAPF